MASTEQTREFATDVVRRLQAAGYVALWAGGCVRDLRMNREPQDYDIATDARPEQVRDLFGHRRTLAVGESFGVIIVLSPKVDDHYIKVEVATFRSEGSYPDGRRPDPDQIRFTTAAEDAQRRDFTINGMFFDPLANQVLDYVDGETDLRAGIIRAIGRPQDRMREDKLRMLRAVRFAATLDFELDPATATAVQQLASEISVVSVERIAQELQKMLVSPHRRRAIRLTQQLGLLSVILPELNELVTADQTGPWAHVLDMLDQLDSPGTELALATLLQHLPPGGNGSKRDRNNAGTVTAIARRLRLSNLQADRIVWLVAHQRDLADAALLPVARLKRILAHEYADDLLNWMRAEQAARQSSTANLEFIDEFLARTPREELNPPPLVTGTDLIALGLPPGPQFQQWLELARDAQLEDRIGTREEALDLIRRQTRPLS